MPFSDIKSGWIDRVLPELARPYARLIRLDRPIGTWLLVIPCWWSVALASHKWPNLWFMFLFAVGAVVMRGAGCVINDLYDRKLDAQVERTRARPLASGEIKPWQAIAYLALLLLIGFGVLLQFNRFTVITGTASLALVFTYPYMKRITWWPQLFLGFTFNWGALLGWTAVRGELDLPAVFLYIAGILWTLGYDTIYAHQDIRDDMHVGVKSTALLFGSRSKSWVRTFYGVAIISLAVSGLIVGLNLIFYAVLIVAGSFVARELYVWGPDNPQDCLQSFKNNRDFGLLILAGILLGRIL